MVGLESQAQEGNSKRFRDWTSIAAGILKKLNGRGQKYHGRQQNSRLRFVESAALYSKHSQPCFRISSRIFTYSHTFKNTDPDTRFLNL